MVVKRYDRDEVLAGVGTIANANTGQAVVHVHYYMDVTHAVLNAATIDEESVGLVRISGKLRFMDADLSGGVDLMGDSLILTVEDGRRLKLVLTNNSGSFDGAKWVG